MKSYFIAIMTSSVVSAICVSLASGTAYEKYVKYVCALICASVIVFPLSGIINITENGLDGPPVPAYTEASNMSSDKIALPYAEEEAKNYICGILDEKFGIIPKDISIEIDIGNGITVGDVTVVLESKDKDKITSVDDFLLSSLGYGIRVVADE